MDGGIEGEVKFRMNEVGKMHGGMKRVFKYRSLGMSAKRRLYKGIVVPTVLYRLKLGIWKKQRRSLNVMEMSCLRSRCGVT